jgi:hypothetical protein
VGVDHVLQGPAARPPGDLGITDGVTVARLQGDKAREAFPPSFDEIEPGVLAERIVAVGKGGEIEQLLHRRDVIGAHFPPNLEPVHEEQGI